jgi:hypothetical protein
MSDGELAILSVGRGDLKITFRPDATQEEKDQARELVEKLMREGYSILVQQADGSYVRASGFDAETTSYIVGNREAPAKKKRGRPRKVAADGAKAVAVARSAGG